MTKKELAACVAVYRELLNKALGHLTDEQGFEVTALFPDWEVGVDYTTGDRIVYGDKLYKALVDHTSAETFTPDITNYQWVEITNPAVEWPEWKQPLGYADAYAAGAKVIHNGIKWISDVDNNTWEPGVYGWSQA